MDDDYFLCLMVGDVALLAVDWSFEVCPCLSSCVTSDYL